ncbi:MAG: hypothetical protein QHJ34_04605 [bacterium]|jgi:hypothetical protein|nr:photosystem II reaction center PsbP family protein [candidate division KSB1 bacterium]MDH7559498.1 hypothetical protein [bacterium]
MKRTMLVPVGLLLVGLAVVVALSFYLRTFEKQAKLIREQIPPVPDEPVVTVAGQYFFDTIDRFSFKMPGDGWQVHVLVRPDTLPPEIPTRAMLKNMVPLAVLDRVAGSDTMAKATVGVMRQTVMRNAEDSATQMLGELISQCERGPARLRLLKEVTTAGTGVHAAAYFMVVLPPEAQEPLPVWVCSVTVREGLSIIFLAQTTEARYPEVRADFEKIVESFRWL